MERLTARIQNYDWGDSSFIARLQERGESGRPEAELWMGTHPSGPSMVLIEQPWRTITPLNEWLKLNPSMLYFLSSSFVLKTQPYFLTIR